MPALPTALHRTCSHCGEDCSGTLIGSEHKVFCCEGCKLVYQLINQNGLCEYYSLNDQPGITQKIPVRKDKFAFLEDVKIRRHLIQFEDGRQSHVTLYLPQIHCSSCLYLLENLHQLKEGVLRSQVNFPRKEINVVIDETQLTLRGLVETLAGIGYEPHISLSDFNGKPKRMDRSKIYQLGVAGFCFSNIMLLSFPEYLGLAGAEKSLQAVFRWLSLFLATPVFLYSSYPFFSSGWSGLKNKYLNIDAPIALAILVTFCRSVYEVVSGTGSGYFDSMTGIVFFMLVGRILQDKTYQQLSFERDYTSYFPIAVTVLKEGKEVPVALPDIRPGDTLLIHHEELIPADGILTRGKGSIDYSFVTGESIPVVKDMGEIVYAGGKQTLATIELLVIKEVAQSYLTRLWSGEQFNKESAEKQHSFVNLLSRYFTLALFTIALLATIYWGYHNSRMVWNVLTAVLIVACPCALLLSNTFTNGNILRILGRNHLYLRNAQAIENIAAIDYIVFDKTGTLTTAHQQEVTYKGKPLDPDTRKAIVLLAGQSGHPLSRAIATYYGSKDTDLTIQGYHEVAGKGIEGSVNGSLYALGSKAFISGQPAKDQGQSQVWFSRENEVLGYYQIANHYRQSIPEMIRSLGGRYPIAVASGDHSAERENLSRIFGPKALLLFGQHPQDKLDLIRKLQQGGKKVMMIGDGLNDAGALKQSDVGIAITENTNTFTPACDAILEAEKLGSLGRFILLCKWNQKVVVAAFLLSIAYNIVGLSFAVQGLLSPLTAAVLMPASSISIVLITFGGTNLIARLQKL